MGEQPQRQVLAVAGLVQGVGFRPFVYRLATARLLGGWVRNDAGGVTICVEGDLQEIRDFGRDLIEHVPDLARIDSCRVVSQEPITHWTSTFLITGSAPGEGSGTLVTPDGHVCADCERELFDPADRRFGYPLINCTNCGPRYSIVRGVPYDRPLTTMAEFAMCERCRAEYDSPADRRFHAQPTACWACGPTVRLLAADGSERACADPVAVAAGLLRAGEVLAVKALGGYQIMVDPHDASAVAALRARKERSAKPFALLARDAGVVARYAEVTDPERRLLESPGRPIVLLRARPGNRLSEEVAPGSSTLGFMLPATPLQHLLLAAATDALIATSGNAPDEPMARTEAEALRVLGGVVGGFLTHDRPIHVRVDDSIARVVRSDLAPKLTFLRRARGYAPDPIPAPFPMTPTLSVGAELKDTVCVASGTSLYLSQHIGDLKTAGNREFFAETVDHLCDLFDVTPCLVASDIHPDFHSTHYAARYAADHPGVERILVQHHHAHMAACMADNGLDRRVIAVVFDGTGYGLDGTIWGGEFLVGDYDGFERAAHLERFRLPGGDQAVRHPWRVAAALLQQHGLPLTVLDDQDPFEVEVVAKMAARAVNSPVTSSMGRLFDAVSALLGVRRSVSYEAQAAIELEQLLGPDHKPHTPWPTRLSRDGDGIVISHEPWIRALAESQDEPAAVSSGRFHESVVQAVKEVCLLLRDTHGLDDVVLSGGVFLNQYLLVRVERELTDSGLRVHTHGRVPTNDGGISVGQAVIAAARKRSNNGQASPGKPRADGGTAQTVRADHRAVLRR